EEYRIDAGEVASWQLGNGDSRPGIDFDTTSAGRPKESGSQVFPGFQPANELDRSRNSVSVYGGLESQVSERFLVDVGGRLESYSDFGRRFNWKVASRLEVAPRIAVRGAASTGFRAPSLAQVWFNNVSNQFAIDASGNLVLNRVLTSNNQSRVTKAFGIPDLAEETSVNLSAGITAQPRSNVSLTADFYRVTIDNRIVLTSQFSSLAATEPNAAIRARIAQTRSRARRVRSKCGGSAAGSARSDERPILARSSITIRPTRLTTSTSARGRYLTWTWATRWAVVCDSPWAGATSSTRSRTSKARRRTSASAASFTAAASRSSASTGGSTTGGCSSRCDSRREPVSSSGRPP